MTSYRVHPIRCACWPGEHLPPADDQSQYLGSPHQPVAVLGLHSYRAILKSCLSNIFWSGFWDGDAIALESNWITNVEAGSNRARFATASPFRVQMGSNQ